MADNNEDDVRNVIVSAIQAEAVALGFDAGLGNVHAYLLNEELKEKVTGYLYALVNGKNRVRSWAVQVYTREEYSATREIPTRLYRIIIEGYYGAHGSTPINTLIEHARIVRSAILGLTLRLSGTVDRVISAGDLNVSRLNLSETEELFLGRMIYTAEKYNPTWS